MGGKTIRAIRAPRKTFGFCVEKGSELKIDDERRKYKYRRGECLVWSRNYSILSILASAVGFSPCFAHSRSFRFSLPSAAGPPSARVSSLGRALAGHSLGVYCSATITTVDPSMQYAMRYTNATFKPEAEMAMRPHVWMSGGPLAVGNTII